MRRSQAIQRLPVDSVLATLVTDDGERGDVLLFIPPGETISHVISPGLPFVPMIRNAQFCLVARGVIAALAVAGSPPATADDGLPIVERRVRIRLRSKTALEGELRWISLDGHKRTSDHVNDPDSHLVLHTTERGTPYTYYVAKSQVATIEEL